MTNQGAIEILKTERNHMIPTLLPERIEAMDMAISALQAQDLQPTCNNLAIDTISRTAAIDYCYALINAENPSDPSDGWNYSQERINQTEVILHHLEFMPSAQQEIVRCKDCKHSEFWYRDKRRCFLWHEEGIDVFEDGFCNYAERRTDD